jgi:nitroreductase
MIKNPQSFHDLVRQRQSVRQFLDKPLDATQIDTVLQDAQRAPSNCNTQPWKVHIVSGAVRSSLTQVLIAHADGARYSPDFSWDETAFPDPLDVRRRAQGKAYYEALGIARDDKAGRHEAMLRNLNFFGAPHAAFLFMPAVGDSVRVASDVGMYAQTFLLSLAAQGFAGIPQTLLGLFAEPIRAHLGVPDEMKLLFGISFGYADPAGLALAPTMPRAPISDSCVMHGYPILHMKETKQ